MTFDGLTVELLELGTSELDDEVSEFWGALDHWVPVHVQIYKPD